MKSKIVVRNARQHNLKGIDLDLPRRSLIVVTGPSGSGKSSLAFDTIYAEGQRRYVESLSSYAKQFLDRMEKPAVDLVEGISPAVAIEQKNPTKTSRSTVGTATEVHDYLRLLWARVGHVLCPMCGRDVRPDTVQSATDRVLALPPDSRFQVAFPLPRSARVDHKTIVENLRALGFQRVLVGAEALRLDEAGAEDPGRLGHDLAGSRELMVVVDRLRTPSADDSTSIDDLRGRLADSLATAFAEGDGEAAVVIEGQPQILLFTERFRCPDHPDSGFLEPSPRLFSFNNPYGSCPGCTGFGAVLEYDESLIVPDPARSLDKGAIDPWEKPRYKKYRKRLLDHARAQGVNVKEAWDKLPAPFRKAVIRGGKDFRGVMSFMKSREKKRYKQYIRVFLRQYQSAIECPACGGSRLRPEALYVKIDGIDIATASALSIERLRDRIEALGLTDHERQVASSIVKELRSRLRFLDEVGLGYLTLDRQTRTLSGGEAQRINIANSLGSQLVDTLYVLDEPTIGLHPRDNDRLLGLLGQLRSAGNTVLVVEHDPAAIESADHIVELGPGSGEKGGSLVFEGTFDELTRADTVTGRYLRSSASEGAAVSGARARRRDVAGRALELRGARLHNLAGVDVRIPLGALTVVTGVSGSGKSTLVHDVLYRGLERTLEGSSSAKRHLGEVIGGYDALEGAGQLDAVVLVDQSPIGRTPRSNPVTYIKAFDRIRELFAAQPLARQRGYTAGTFSFNVRGGRCEACKGDGLVQVEMVFLADVFVPCDMCGGSRYKPEVLEVTVKGLSIRRVLDLTIDEAIRFFIKEDRLGQMLWQLQQVGLGYLRLGQPAPTLSGGEAQRLKIARELVGAGKRRGRRMYVLDEPTTGLSGSEAITLVAVLGRLLDAGHTVVVIEHNLEVIRAADWIIDLGPDAGPEGGRVVAMGTPEDVADVDGSHTARYLRPLLRDRGLALRAG